MSVNYRRHVPTSEQGAVGGGVGNGGGTTHHGGSHHHHSGHHSGHNSGHSSGGQLSAASSRGSSREGSRQASPHRSPTRSPTTIPAGVCGEYPASPSAPHPHIRNKYGLTPGDSNNNLNNISSDSGLGLSPVTGGKSYLAELVNGSSSSGGGFLDTQGSSCGLGSGRSLRLNLALTKHASHSQPVTAAEMKEDGRRAAARWLDIPNERQRVETPPPRLLKLRTRSLAVPLPPRGRQGAPEASAKLVHLGDAATGSGDGSDGESGSGRGSPQPAIAISSANLM